MSKEDDIRKNLARQRKEDLTRQHGPASGRERRRIENELSRIEGVGGKDPLDVFVGLITTGLVLAAMAGGGGRAEASTRAPQLDQKPGISSVDATPQPTIPLPRGRALLRR